jgi:hypothetical protein
MNMALKRLDGWEPKTTTTVTKFDGAGRAVRWETVTEPEWDTRERSLMLALAYWEAGLCRRCGEHMSKTLDPMTDPDRPEATRRWVAEGPDECDCCKAMVRAERKLADDENAGGMAAWAFHTPALIAVKPRLRRKRR